MNTNASNPDPLVVVLILNYCSMDDTVGCAATVRVSKYSRFRLLVIDNASPDGSGACLARQFPEEEFLQLPRNTGYAGGNNEGIRIALAAGADVVLILNPDVRLPPESIGHYVSVLRADPSIGALNAIQVGADGKTIDRAFARGVLAPAGFRATTVDETIRPALLETPVLFGAALALPRHAIERVGAFDPLYFAYGEEIDLCRRLKYHGLRLVVTSQWPVLHLRSKYAGGVSDFVLFLKLKGAYLSRLKDPTASFRQALTTGLRELVQAAFGSPPRSYPFTSHAVPRAQVLRTIGWIAVHALTAWRHKRMEKRGRVYV